VVNKASCVSWCVCGVWLRAKDTDIGAGLWISCSSRRTFRIRHQYCDPACLFVRDRRSLWFPVKKESDFHDIGTDVQYLCQILPLTFDRSGSKSKVKTIGVGDGGQGEHVLPPQKKIGKNIFRAIIYVKFEHFSGKNHVKFGNFVNFSGKYYKNSGILIISRAGVM